MANLQEVVAEYVKAGFAGIWIRSQEHEDAIAALAQMAKDNDWAIGHWDIDVGLKGNTAIASQRTTGGDDVWYGKKPLPLIKDLPKIARQADKKRTLIILKNFHRKELIENTQIIQALQNSITEGKAAEQGWYIIILSPETCIPIELEVDFVVVDHELPTKEQLWGLANDLANEGELPTTEDGKLMMLEAAAGMTHRGAENAFSLSIIKKKPFDPGIIWDLKAQALKKKGLLGLAKCNSGFEGLGGLDQWKKFSLKLLNKRTDNPMLYPKGQLLLGVPGGGKSAAVTALGYETGRRVLTMSMGSLRGKFQGETENNVISALQIADAMAPCILFVDEIEKALSGTESSGATDGGATMRVFGTLLTWLNDHESDVFFVGTCNNISALPPEFTRAERFDGIFFFDLPSFEERKVIWDIHLTAYQLKTAKAKVPANFLNMSEDWTGAEIKTCCRLAAMMGMPIEESALNVVPVFKTAESRLKDLRKWASGRCLSASNPGLFQESKLANPLMSAINGKGGLSRTRNVERN